MNNNMVRNLSLVAAAIGLLSCCVLSPVAGFAGYNYAQSQAPTVAHATKEAKATEAPEIAVDDTKLCYGVIDGSVVPFGSKVELNPSTSTSVTGPAVVEWWVEGGTAPVDTDADGIPDKFFEGMWYLHTGESLTIPAGVRGGYWQIQASSAMTAEEGLQRLIESHLHLYMFSIKPQHDYAAEAVRTAMETCDWSELTNLMVRKPSTE